MDIHGAYNKVNTKKLIALAVVKLITDDDTVKLKISSGTVDVALEIEKIETISSFAITPTTSAQIMAGELSPIGANIKLILLEIKYRILFVISCVKTKLVAVCVNIQIIIPTLITTPKMRFAKSMVFVFTAVTTCETSMCLSGGNSKSNSPASVGRIVYLKFLQKQVPQPSLISKALPQQSMHALQKKQLQ